MARELKFYFFGSIRGGAPNLAVFQELIKYLKTKGAVLSEHLFDNDYAATETLDSKQIHDRDVNWIKESDFMIGDVTATSLGVGYEIREGVSLSKPILCLYHPTPEKELSNMIKGSPTVVVKEYNSIEEAKAHIDKFLEEKNETRT